MLTRIALPLISIAMLCFALIHVVSGNQTNPKLPPMVEPAKQPFAKTVAGAGIVEPKSENISIGAYLPGIVTEIMVKVNDTVEPGTPLFRLDDRHLAADEEVKKAELTIAKEELKQLEQSPKPQELLPLEARVQEAKAVLASAVDASRRANDLARTGAIGEEEVVQRRNAEKTAIAQLARAEADLALMKKEVEVVWERQKDVLRSRIQLAEERVRQVAVERKRMIVTAPIRGKVLQKDLHVGEYVGIPAGRTLMVLGDTSTLHIRMDVDEADIPRLNLKAEAIASPRGNGEVKIPLKFVRVEPLVVPKKSLTGLGTERVDTRVLQVIFAVQSTPQDLYVGQQLEVFLRAE
ncbi:MAG: HlyD family efflux transporter periplasmic adaptor subunit [Zavarzinella sp.]